MTAKRPDFTDVFYATARAQAFEKEWKRLQDEGDTKGARAAKKEAVHWLKEAERLNKAVKRAKKKS